MKRNQIKNIIIVIGFLTVAGCTIFKTKPEDTLYERLGKKSAIEMVVSDFVDRVGEDSRITNATVNARLASIDMTVLKKKITNLMCMVTGGPCKYEGRDMKTAHAGYGITNADFDYVVDDLVKTLDNYKVGEQEKNELVSLLAPLRDDIVEIP